MSLSEEVRSQLWAALAFEEPSERRAERARMAARELVKEYRPAIEALAQALMDSGEINSA